MVIGIELNDVLRDFTKQFEYVYNKFFDKTFELGEMGMHSFNPMDVFPFITEDEYRKFRYEDYPFELFGRADPCSKTLNADFNKWTSVDIMDVDEDKVPHVILFSALESNLTIQATLSYLSVNMCRVRDIRFPTDSTKMWDTCDLIITANPNILSAKPDGKVSVKIKQPYNDGIEADYTYDDMEALIHDTDRKIIKLIENSNEISDN